MKRSNAAEVTFDDVLLLPARSSVTPDQVALATQFSRNIALNIPLVSAAMDTVSESPLCIALAREGGIGVIHKNMSPETQAERSHARETQRIGDDSQTAHACRRRRACGTPMR